MMRTDFLFSVVTITRDNFQGLQKTAQSVMDQSFRNFEWIIQDGASSDETQDYIQSLTEQQNINIKWETRKDKGIFDAMNKGLEKSSGVYVIFMNAGDTFASFDVLQRICERLSENEGRNPAFIFGDSLEMPEPHKPVVKKAKPVSSIPYGMITHHQAMFYSTDNIRKMNLTFNTAYRCAGDYDFTLRFLLEFDRCLKLDFAVCLFEKGGISEQNPEIGRREEYEIRKEILRWPETLNKAYMQFQSFKLLARKTLDMVSR